MNINDLRNASELNKALAEADKAFDESISTLIQWLTAAMHGKYMDPSQAKKYFKEELDRREQQMKPTSD